MAVREWLAPARLPGPQPARVPADAMPVAQRQPERSPRRRSAPYAIGAVAIVVIIAIAAWLRATLGHSTPLPAAERSIAVLPFANVCGDQQDAAFVDGLREGLIAVQTGIPS